MSDLLDESTDLAERYSEKFKNSQWFDNAEFEAQWKRENAKLHIGDKCAIVYNDANIQTIKGDSQRASKIRSALDRAGYPDTDKAITDYNDAYAAYDSESGPSLKGALKAVATGGESGVSPGKRHVSLADLYALTDDWLRVSGCKSRAEIGALLEAKWVEAQANSILEEIKDDLNEVGSVFKGEALDCLNKISSEVGKIQKYIDAFWETSLDEQSGMWPPTFAVSPLRGQLPTPAHGDPANAVIGDTGGITKYLAAPPGASVNSGLGLGVPNYLTIDTSTTDRFTNWDHILMQEAYRKKLKVTEYANDLGQLSASNQDQYKDMPHLYASFVVAVMNVVEGVLLKEIPTQQQIDNFEAGANDSSDEIFQTAEKVSNLLNASSDEPADSAGSQNLLPPNSAPSVRMDIMDVIGYGKDAASRLPDGKTKSWLVNLAYKTLEDSLKIIAENNDCVLDAKKKFDDFIDRVQAAIPDVDDGNDSWLRNDDRVKKELEKATANLDTTDMDDVGFSSASDKKLFKEQCFLLAFAGKIANFKNQVLDYSEGVSATHSLGVHKRLAYANLSEYAIKQVDGSPLYNACLQMTGDSFGFINRLTQTPAYSSLIDIPHHQLSALQPKIRLFKVEYEDGENADGEAVSLEKEVEMAFNSAFSTDELEGVFKNRKTRSAGVGLQSFEFTYDGSNPFSHKKSIKAKLVLHSATFQELFLDRIGKTKIVKKGKLVNGPTQKYRYVDLALKTFSKYTNNNSLENKYAKIIDENVNLAKLNFRLKAVVGWSVPKGNIPGLSTAQKQKLKTVLSNSYVTLNLTPTIHTFNFKQDGSVSFEIDYLAYIDDFFDDRGFNVFADPNGKVGWKRELRKMKMARVRSSCSSADQIKDLNEEYQERVESEISDSLSSLVTSMIDRKKIYYINLDYSKVQDFVASGPYINYEEYIMTNSSGDIVLSDSTKDEVTADLINNALAEYEVLRRTATNGGGSESEISLGASLYAASPNSAELSFFYLSDLIDTILENIQKELDMLVAYYEDETQQEAHATDSETNLKKVHKDEWKKRTRDLKKYKANLKRFRILLGPVELQHHGKGENKKSVFVNMGDLPISVKYFMEWIAGKVFSKDEVFYSLSVFINQIMNNLVTQFLNNNKCFFFDIKQKVRVNQASITSYSPPENKGVDEITKLMLRKASAMRNLNSGGSPTNLNVADAVVRDYQGFLADGSIKGGDWKNLRPILNVSGRPNGKGSNYPPLSFETNYMVFYAGRVAAAGGTGVRAVDQDRGIFHYLLGRDRGLVKEINLKKTQTKGLAEARFEMDGYDGLSQLRVVYDLDISTYANVNTYPGTYIYVPPSGFDPSFVKTPPTVIGKDGKKVNIDITNLGIGGYYMIIRSTHRFAMGEASSQIYAKWVNSLTSDYPAAEGGVSLSKTPSEGACKVAIDKRLDEMNKP